MADDQIGRELGSWVAELVREISRSCSASAEVIASTLDADMRSVELARLEARVVVLLTTEQGLVQKSYATADNEDMAYEPSVELDEQLPDGAIPAGEDLPLTIEDVNLYRDVGAPAWFIRQAMKLVEQQDLAVS